jgi:formiminotetrahydrofolate cyclodeaminase
VTSPRALLDELIAGGSPAAGSGVAAALVAAIAASVVREAARRSGVVGAAAQAERLRNRALPLADANSRAYLEASERLAGRNDDFELGRALERAADVPLRIAAVAADVGVLATHVAEQADPAVRADAVGAAFLAEAAARSAAHLVEINLGTGADDPRVLSARSLVAAATASAAALAE